MGSTTAPPVFDEAAMDAAARVVGLTIPEASRQNVLRFLSIAEAMSEALAAAPLPPDELALASTFAPDEETP